MLGIYDSIFGAWTCSSVVERFIHIEEVRGSNPLRSTYYGISQAIQNNFDFNGINCRFWSFGSCG